MLYRMIIAILLCLQIITPITGSSSGPGTGPGEEGCLTVGGMAKAQRRVCSRAPAAGAAALQGLKAATAECRHQLRKHRWDCSALNTRAYNPHSSPIMQRGYRESAFVYALTSAGVAHSVSRACAQGQLLACSCDPSSYRGNIGSTIDNSIDSGISGRAGGGSGSGSVPKPSTRWKWGGCSPNMEYGMTFSRMFLDSRETAGDLHSKVNLHNNEAGRLALYNNMSVRCKCHGTSGSCQVRTCWRAALPLRTVGRVLRRSYESAKLVGRSNSGRASADRFSSNRPHRTMQRKRKLRKNFIIRRKTKKHNKQNKPSKDSLIYYENSPNYCERDPSLEINGTVGRRCSRSRASPGSCTSLCCGRGHDLTRTRLTQSCRCKFHWCCQVECDVCEREEWTAVCK